MKVNKIHIIKFGKISDLEIDIKDGINFIYGIEEVKKTTIIDFIHAMLYGTTDTLNNDMRAKYVPDESSDMSGILFFEHDGNEYELTRTFHAYKNTKDTITLKNITTDKSEELSYSIVPGEYILNLNKQSFRRNTYVNQSESVAIMKTSHTDIMSSILSNLISTADEKISISDIAQSLNSNFDVTIDDTIMNVLTDKKERLTVLKEEFEEAKKSEQTKIESQKECMQLQADYEMYNSYYQKAKDNIEYQELRIELDNLKNSESSHISFLEASKQYDQKSAQLNLTRIPKYKKEFQACCELLKEIEKIKEKREAYVLRKKKIGVDLGRYTPKDNTDELENICDANKMIEDTNYNLSQLNDKLSGLNAQKNQLKDSILKADFEFQNASTDYAHFEEISRHKLLLAEEKLHSSSHKVSIEPIKQSKNLIYASIILIILSLLLIVYLNNILAVTFLLIGMATCFYAIAVKIRKEKKVNISRVDENKLRYAEIEMRSVKNKYNSDADRYKSQISIAKKKISELKEQELKLSDEISNINAKITQTKENLDFYLKQKSLSESKITQPDPKYFSLKSDIKAIEVKIQKCDDEIGELSDKLVKDLSTITKIDSHEEAIEFINKNSALLKEIDEINQQLIIYGDKEKIELAGAALKEKIASIEGKLKPSDSANDIPKLSKKEVLALKEKANSMLEKALEIKNKYITSITTMKVQYNDGKSLACLEKQIDALEKEVSYLENAQRSIKYSIENYNSVLSEMREGYIPQTAKRASEILSELTDGKYSGVTIKGGKIAIKDKDKKIINFDTISKATCDQIYFSLRLAVAEITENNITTPLILDDIFLISNEEKASQLLRFLINYKPKSQIMIFSHHNQVSKLAAKDDISIEDINMLSLKNII